MYTVGTNIPEMTKLINNYSTALTDYLEERELLVSPEKSTVTLFTPASAEMKIHPQVFVQGKLVKLEQRPVLLGVTFDTMYTFSPHIKNTVAKAKAKTNILKALAGSTWGQQKETLTLTYKTIVRSTLEYGNPIWSPSIKNTNWDRLQRVQNQGLRIATGCLTMSSIDHLHQETKVIPIKPHCELLTKQFLSSAHVPDHPGHKHLNKPATKRRMKLTLNIYENEVSSKFESLPATTQSRKSVLKTLHTETVQKVLDRYNPNPVLNKTPPKINPEEVFLTRKSRTELARLRSGFSRTLNSYLSRVDPDTPDNCPKCTQSPHNSIHLFSCPSNPTHLTVESLWTKPKEAAEFLKLDELEE